MKNKFFKKCLEIAVIVIGNAIHFHNGLLPAPYGGLNLANFPKRKTAWGFV